MADFDTTDACSGPLPPRCVPGQFDSPVCYQVGAGPILQGTQRITRLADCSISTVEILDTNDQVVVGAVVVGCPGSDDCCDVGSLCSILQGLPTQVPGGADTAVYVTPGGCFLGIPVATVAFPVLAPNGTCAAPSYSFAASPSSGMWFDPAVGPAGAVVISDNNCANRLEVGASINLAASSTATELGATLAVQSAAFAVGGSVVITGGAGLPDASPGQISVGGGDMAFRGGDIIVIAGNGNSTVPGGETHIFGGASADGQGGRVLIQAGFGNVTGAGGNVDVVAGIGGGGVHGSFTVTTGPASSLRFSVDGAGAYLVGAVQDPGAVGQVLTSNGPAAEPSWQAPGAASFPLLAPDGSCAAPSYSFTSDTAGGMWFDPSIGPSGAVVISDHNCTNRINVGASISLQSDAGSNIELLSGSDVFLDAANDVTLNADVAGTVSLRLGGVASLEVIPGGEWVVGGSTGTAGQVIVSNGAAAAPTWQVIPPGSSANTLWSGAQNIINANDTRDMPWGYDDSVNTNAKEMVVPRSGTIRNLYVRHNTANGNGASVVYTLALNGVNTALTATLATGALGTASDLVNTVAVVAGDRIACRRTIAASIGVGTIEVMASMEML